MILFRIKWTIQTKEIPHLAEERHNVGYWNNKNCIERKTDCVVHGNYVIVCVCVFYEPCQ